MTDRFIVDFSVAHGDRFNYFTDDWKWPVAQSTYDDVLREFIEWSYRLPGELSHDETLRLPYELVEIDLLKELVSIVAVWIDVAESKRADLNLVTHPRQVLYGMFKLDSFDDYSVVQDIYQARYGTLRSRIGRRLRRFGRWSGIHRIDNPTLSISPNGLTNQIAPISVTDFRIDPDDLNSVRASRRNLHPGIEALAEEIVSHIDAPLKKIDSQLTPAGRNFVKGLIRNHLRHGCADQNMRLPVANVSSSTHLFTGTGGIYRSRLASHLVMREGGSVTRTTHGVTQSFSMTQSG